MELIDGQGRLFGLINVIDALVIVVVISVIIATIPFVTPSGESREPASRYVTLDLGTQPPYLAELLEEGEEMTTSGGSDSFRITDVYVSPANATDGSVSVTIRGVAEGSVPTGDSREKRPFRYAGDTLLIGDRVSLSTAEYEITGTVVGMENARETLETRSQSVVVRSTVPTYTANAIQSGDTYRVAGQVVATVRSVDVYPADSRGEKRVTLGVELVTLQRDGRSYFGDKPVRLNDTIPFVTESYRLSVTIVAKGANSLPESADTKTIVVQLQNVQPAIADGIVAGMTERHRGETYAVVREVRTEPSVVTVNGTDGRIFRRTHLVEKDVYLTVEIHGTRSDGGFRFHGRPLQEGSSVTLDLRTITVTGTVVEIQEASGDGAMANRSIG